MNLITTSIIGAQTAANAGRTFRAVNAATGAALEPEFTVAINWATRKSRCRVTAF